MKKILLAFLCLMSMSTNKVHLINAETDYYARSYVLMDGNNGDVLEQKNPFLERSVASISKIMTAIIAIESQDLFHTVVVDDIIKTIEGSSLYLSEGDQITIIDLVYGLLLRSGNDAAVLIAKHIGKEIPRFVDMMNEKADELGMKHTTFHNPSGLDIFDEGNISCAFDMCLLMKYCSNNALFEKIDSSENYYNPIKGNWKNKNKLLFSYENCYLGKTGYTKKAKRTLVTAAKKNDAKLICCTLDCGSDFTFHKALYEKYLSHYEYIVFLYKGKNYVDNYFIESNETIGIFLPSSKIVHGKKLICLYPDNDICEIIFLDVSNQEIAKKTIEGVKFRLIKE